ncbi:MAG: zf-TFIIB domain-containing protein [Planctomycetales bacterium]|nr:zf-TFIIB domain-containing protein [Planctomycetales bacterium]
MHGLSFISHGLSAGSRDRWEHERLLERHKRSIERGKAMKLRVHEELTDHERAVLRDLYEQLENAEPNSESKSCPECSRPMATIDCQGILIDVCPRCRGCWFDPGELQMFTGLDKEVPGDDLVSRKGHNCCAVCGRRMTEYVFLNPFNLLVDRCSAGHGVYLEDRELERIFEII